MNKQEVILRIVAAHLARQGKRSIDGELCSYSMIDENKNILYCAAGCLAPYDIVSKLDCKIFAAIRSQTEIPIYSEFINFLKDMDIYDPFLIMHLQEIHDHTDLEEIELLKYWQNEGNELCIKLGIDNNCWNKPFEVAIKKRKHGSKCTNLKQ